MSTDEVMAPKRPLDGMTRQERRRLERESKRAKSTIPTIHLVVCPSCNKKRHTKYEDSEGKVLVVNTETITVRGEQRFIDVCANCSIKYQIKDQRFIIQNLKKLQNAAKSRNDGTTDKDFTIDI
jgi:uncharacterized protein YbaR (Trm112 family)